MTTSKGQMIGGQWLVGGGHQFSSLSPFDGGAIWTGPAATPEECDMAVDAARRAFIGWAQLELEQRLSYLHAFTEVLKEEKLSLAERISAEIGKPKWEALTEVAAMIGKVGPTEQSYRDRNKDFSRQQGVAMSRTHFRPHGVVAILGPYNFPGHMPNGHIMPALLAGNAVIFKPSEIAPAVAEKVVECWLEAGLPAGVLNLVQGGPEVGKYLCNHPAVNAIFFTGSRAAGESISASASVEKITALEMGGNSPLVVWDSSNVSAAVFATIQSAFITTGQRCSTARRLIVPNNSFGKEFLDRLIDATKKIRIGTPDQAPEPYMGPMRLPRMVDYLLQKQAALLSRGGIALEKCERLPVGGAFITPGIIDVTEVTGRDDEEVLGPLLQVIRVEDFQSAIDEANNTTYGLAAGIFTEKPGLYEVFINSVKAGVFSWNQQLTGASSWAPFGGIKRSGNFRPSGYLAADYCVYSTATLEAVQLTLPPELPPGISI